MSGYITEEIPAEELTRQIERAREIGDSVRSLVAATVVTDVDDDDLAEARRHIDAATEILERRRIDASFGLRFNSDGRLRNWGNAVEGIRNPIAPPVEFHAEPDHVWSELHLGPQYEGPPGLVHGGVIALILDQVLGNAAVNAGAPGMTGTLTIRYRKGTPLGSLRVEGRLDRTEGHKSFASGTISTADGLCAEAEGIFIMPRWARGLDASRQMGVGDA
ncbi:PaaI family thioesterase [Gordonia sp. SID5947]|uniref:PaaI family thioesterase n=1 Tax=Gordonia sp. SID5947 TaxID=2690315 RepID=UPI001368C960|nr:PaaI family thioesterase [Gordonia sp. SID5947]MYR05430.1 PaaI family thioesterase [Gordonia sp. SID5947]